MRFPSRLLVCACLAGFSSGCATFGTNVEGDFTCRAPKGDCAPTHVIDAKATNTLPSGTTPHAETRPRSGVVDADTTRTAERTLRVVFPAHVDEARARGVSFGPIGSKPGSRARRRQHQDTAESQPSARRR